jgi:hypothetical protein
VGRRPALLLHIAYPYCLGERYFSTRLWDCPGGTATVPDSAGRASGSLAGLGRELAAEVLRGVLVDADGPLHLEVLGLSALADAE